MPNLRRCALAALLILATGPAAHAEIKAQEMFKGILTRELKLEANTKVLLDWLEKNVFPTFKDCGTGKDGVAIDPKTWEFGFLFEYYPADRGKPPKEADFPPACYTPTGVCFRRDPQAPLEFDMDRYKKFPDTNECGLFAESFTIKEPYPTLEIKSALYQGTIQAKMKYWEKRTSFAKLSPTASQRNAPGRARAGDVVTGLGYGNIVVDLVVLGAYQGKDREVEFPGPFESPHRRFCYTTAIAARSGATCARE